ncbi:MAG: hypothetical protein E7386_05105 [Ruminococcaceae bacterium]|nr:hypothetical protein [Oscillospiraceae bacterium]
MRLNLIKRLTAVIMRSNSMEEAGSKKRKGWIIGFTVFVLLFVIFPVTIMTGIFTHVVTARLAEAGHPEFGVKFMYGIISIFSVVFGINVIFNELYFEDDISYLLPLPLKAEEIVLARFAAVFIGENMMQFAVVIAVVTGFGTAYPMNVLRWILSLVLGFLLPVIPMAVIAIAGMLLMTFTRFIKKKETVRRISFVIILLILGAGAFMLLTIDIGDIVGYIIDGTASNILFVRVLDVLFPQTGLIAGYMASGSVPYLLLFIGICIVSVILLALAAHFFYMESVTRLNETTHVQKNPASAAASVSRSAGMTLFVKEMRMLVRTPAFLTNCVAANFVWPVFVPIFARIMKADIGREAVALYFTDGKHKTVALMVILAITMVTAAMNCLGSDSFSREGKGFDYIKFIPVNYRLQWNVKLAAAMVWTLAGTVPFFVFFVIYARFDVLTSVLTAVMTCAAAFFVTELGMLLDSLNPKLFWLDALSALRENYNTVFCMGITIVSCALLCGVMFLVAAPALSSGIVLFALCAADAVLYLLSMKAGVRNIMQVGE